MQGQGYLQAVLFKEKKNISASTFTSSVMNQGLRMTWECTWVQIHTPPLMT